MNFGTNTMDGNKENESAHVLCRGKKRELSPDIIVLDAEPVEVQLDRTPEASADRISRPSSSIDPAVFKVPAVPGRKSGARADRVRTVQDEKRRLLDLIYDDAFDELYARPQQVWRRLSSAQRRKNDSHYCNGTGALKTEAELRYTVPLDIDIVMVISSFFHYNSRHDIFKKKLLFNEFLDAVMLMSQDEDVTEYKAPASFPAGSGDEFTVLNPKTDEVQQSVRKTMVHDPQTEDFPQMYYYQNVETNVIGEENLQSSGVPHVSDDQDDNKLRNGIRRTFPEGIRGEWTGASLVLHDRVLFEMLRDLRMFYREACGQARLYWTLVYLFPLKLTMSTIQEYEFDLYIRYMYKPPLPELPPNSSCMPGKHWNPPDFRDAPPVLHVRRRRALKNICEFCHSRFCSGHDLIESVEESGKGPVEFGELVMPLLPCSENCFKLLYEKELSDPELPLKRFEYTGPSEDWQLGIEDSLIQSLLRVRTRICEVGMRVFHSANYQPTCEEIFLRVREAAPRIVFLEYEEIPIKTVANPKKAKTRASYAKQQGLSLAQSPAPCKHEGPCGVNEPSCYCAKNGIYCMASCVCSDECLRRISGCTCAPGRCSTTSCPCWSSHWECSPNRCRNCKCELNKFESEELSCRNTAIQRQHRAKMSLMRSHIVGWGCQLDEDVKKSSMISEYCGELINVEELERRGLLYDLRGCTYIFNLSDSIAIDSHRAGNLIKYANHSKRNANCFPRIVRSEHGQHVGLYAMRDLPAGTELLFDYGDAFHNGLRMELIEPDNMPPQKKKSKLEIKIEEIKEEVEEADP